MTAGGLQLDGSSGDQFRLVESSLTRFPGVQRHGHNQNFRIRKMWLQLFDCLSEHSSQNVRGRPDSVVLEQMNQFAQAAVVATVGGGLDVWRFQPAAQSAARF